MPAPTKQQILQLATDCTDDGWVDVIRLATRLGIDVYAVASDEPDYNAKIEYDQPADTFKITVNEKHPDTRRRFSVAHEISHYTLDYAELRQAGVLDRSSNYANNEHREREQRADQFAAEILMPEANVRDYLTAERLDEANFDTEAISRLADHFHVSNPMAVTRLRNMNYQIPYLMFA